MVRYNYKMYEVEYWWKQGWGGTDKKEINFKSGVDINSLDGHERHPFNVSPKRVRIDSLTRHFENRKYYRRPINVGYTSYPTGDGTEFRDYSGYYFSQTKYELGEELAIGVKVFIPRGKELEEWMVSEVETDNTDWVTIVPMSKYTVPVNSLTISKHPGPGEYISTVTAELGVYPSKGEQGGYWYERQGPVNRRPSITVTSPDNQILAEGSSLSIVGNANDEDVGDKLTVRYAVNGGSAREIITGTAGEKVINFNLELAYSEGKLHEEGEIVSENLTEGVEHNVRVWVVDDAGGQSTGVTRKFEIVANKPPKITLDPLEPINDVIASDLIRVKGSVTDPEGEIVTVRYSLAGGSFEEVYSGVGGDFEIQLLVSKLSSGGNQLTVTAEDESGAITEEEMVINKGGKIVPLKRGVAKYKLEPPKGSAKGVVLWIEREVGDLEIDCEISMTANGEPENFKPMILENSGSVGKGLVEDEFIYSTETPQENIILKINLNRKDVNSKEGITLISGVLE